MRNILLGMDRCIYDIEVGKSIIDDLLPTSSLIIIIICLYETPTIVERDCGWVNEV